MLKYPMETLIMGQENVGEDSSEEDVDLDLNSTLASYYAEVPEDLGELPSLAELSSWIPQLYPHGNPTMDVERGLYAYHKHVYTKKSEQLRLGKLMDYGRVANNLLKTGNNLYSREELRAVVHLSSVARDTLILSHLSLVKNLAHKANTIYNPKTLTIEDLEAEGIFGLTYATYKFDWRKGLKFTTYGTWWARQSIQRAIPTQDHAMRTPIYRFSVASKLMKRTKASDRRNRDIEGLARQSSLSAEVVKSTLDYLGQLHVLELDAPVRRRIEPGNITTLGDVIKDERDQKYFESIGEEERIEALKEYLFEILPMREYRILCLKGGLLNPEKSLTFKEIGELFELTRQRVNQIDKDMKTRLAHPKRREKILQIVGRKD